MLEGRGRSKFEEIVREGGSGPGPRALSPKAYHSLPMAVFGTILLSHAAAPN